MRQFFRDVQEWGWIPCRFDPTRTLATPRSVKALIGPAPRVIADDVWAKLLWVGLHLEPADLVLNARGGYCYPIELVRALRGDVAPQWPPRRRDRPAPHRLCTLAIVVRRLPGPRVSARRPGAQDGHALLLRAVPAPHGVRPVGLLSAQGLYRAQLLEANASLQRMLLTIPLTDDERAAVDEGADAVQRLLARPADTPTPAGPTPHEIKPRPGSLLSIQLLRRLEGD